MMSVIAKETAIGNKQKPKHNTGFKRFENEDTENQLGEDAAQCAAVIHYQNTS